MEFFTRTKRILTFLFSYVWVFSSAVVEVCNCTSVISNNLKYSNLIIIIFEVYICIYICIQHHLSYDFLFSFTITGVYAKKGLWFRQIKIDAYLLSIK